MHLAQQVPCWGTRECFNTRRKRKCQYPCSRCNARGVTTLVDGDQCAMCFMEQENGQVCQGSACQREYDLAFYARQELGHAPPAAPMQVTWQRPPPPPHWRPPAAQPAPGPLPLHNFWPAAAITATGVPQGAATAWGPPPPLAAARGAAAASGQTAAAAAAAWGAPLGAAAAAAPTAPVGTNGAPVAELALGHSVQKKQQSQMCSE